MSLKLRLKSEQSVPVEVEGILPETTRSQSLDEIQRSEVFLGNRKHQLGELFDAAGDPSDECIVWEGDNSGVHWIGAKMTSGRMLIEGNAGRHVGSEMSGGEIIVEGDASDWVGGEMHGGMIHVKGRAGHLVGAAYRGSARGMTGGTILVNGDVGNEIGHTMRRGLLAVGGNAGDLGGFNMLAGTILVFGEPGIRYGAGMKRGTIGLFATSPPEVLHSFRKACRYRPTVLPIIIGSMREKSFPVPDDILAVDVDIYNGDFLEGGRGEILTRGAC